MKTNIVLAFFIGAFFLTFPDLYSQSGQKQASSSSEVIHRKAQVSILPYLGTDGFSSDKVSCNVSINILAGSINQVQGFEMGSIVNVDRCDAGKCQLAGIGNCVGGTSSGFQGAGVFNFAKSASGVQAAGLINYVSKGSNVQLAGVANVTTDTSVVQISGLLNNASSAGKCQIAGVVNNTKGSANVQIAGLINHAKEVKSVQISGLLNSTSRLKGTQVGLINVSDTCEGTPVGIINWVKKGGYHKLEISGDELFYTNVAFRSGIQRFHTMLIVGMRPNNFDSPLWNYGWGVGSSFSLNEKTLLDVDLSYQQIIKGSDVCINNRLYKIAVGIDRNIGAKTSVFVALTYNFLSTNTGNSRYDETYSSIAPYSFTNETSGKYNLKSWAGVKIGLRFL
jgi:hypothetical protein